MYLRLCFLGLGYVIMTTPDFRIPPILLERSSEDWPRRTGPAFGLSRKNPSTNPLSLGNGISPRSGQIRADFDSEVVQSNTVNTSHTWLFKFKCIKINYSSSVTLATFHVLNSHIYLCIFAKSNNQARAVFSLNYLQIGKTRQSATHLQAAAKIHRCAFFLKTAQFLWLIKITFSTQVIKPLHFNEQHQSTLLNVCK